MRVSWLRAMASVAIFVGGGWAALQDLQTQGRTDGELFYIAKNGMRFTGMPGWAAAMKTTGS